jgi:hypothetical protein
LNSILITKLLLEASTNINTDIPIKAAVSIGNKEILNILLQYNTNIDQVYLYCCYNTLLSAKAASIESTVNLIFQKNIQFPKKLKEYLKTAIYKEDVETARYIFNKGICIDNNIIVYTVVYNQLEILEYLLLFNPVQFEYTLIAAVRYQYKGIVENLLKQKGLEGIAIFSQAEHTIQFQYPTIFCFLVRARGFNKSKASSLLEIAVKRKYNF